MAVGLGEISLFHEGQTELVFDVHQVRPEALGRLQGCDGLIDPSRFEIGPPEEGVGLGVLGRENDRPLQEGDRPAAVSGIPLLELEVEIGGPQIEQGGEVLAVGGHGLLEGGDGAGRIAQPLVGQPL